MTAYMKSTLYAIARPFICLSVRVTRVDQSKMAEDRVMHSFTIE